MTMHKILKKQVERHSIKVESLHHGLKGLLKDVSKTYEGYEQDNALIERALNISSEELAQNNKKLREYLEIAGVMILAVNENGKVSMINKKGCELIGYQKHEVIGKDWFSNFLPKHAAKEVKKEFDRLISGRAATPSTYTNLILTKKGEERLIEWHNSTIKKENGKIIETLSSGEDITERKMIEDALKKKNEELEAFNKLAVGRELKMIELKKTIKRLEAKLNS